MNKDVIYIDTEDDITAIIGKIKHSKEKVVALVPPKRTGVLQSAVNLRLLARMAENSDKRLVLVTSNKALISLSSVAKIPIAKNLQSKPEIIEDDALESDDSDDIIEGNQIPIGELVKTSDLEKNSDVSDVIDEIDVEKDSPKVIASTPIVKNNVKIPNFVRFRRRLLVGIILVIGLAAFLVWALAYAPAAKVIITAKTSDADVSLALKLGGAEATDVTKNIVQTVTKQLQKDLSVTFTPTGEKNVGEKSTGTITIKNCDTTSAFVIDAGTVFDSGTGKSFLSNSAATVPGYSGSASLCRVSGTGAGLVDVAVTAAVAGASYNIGATDYSIDGINGDIYANGTKMAGGTDKISKVVTADDIQKASQALVDSSTDTYKQQLITQFANGESVVVGSFSIKREAGVSTPAVGAESTGTATLTSKTTFSISAIAQSELQTFLKDAIAKQLDKNQKIYSDGLSTVVLSGYSGTDNGATVNVTATGKVGPNINDAQIIEQVKGLRYGEAQAIIESIKDISSVDIKFSYFWVTTIPNDSKKVDVEFKINNA